MAALAVAAASFLPKIPRDQTLRVDLGDLAPRVTTLTIRWAARADHGENKANPDARSANIEGWTGEVTFRYENGAPRVIEKKIRAADGDYVVEIEIESKGGHRTTAKMISLAGGSVTLDVA
ncbi:MAG: hypothetical protein ACRELY_04240, partial [Polyangiaceae bacterium]